MNKRFRLFKKIIVAKKVVEPAGVMVVVASVIVSVLTLLDIKVDGAAVAVSVGVVYSIYCGIKNWIKNRQK